MANPSQSPIDYYREREQCEISLAEAAVSQAIRNIHLEMAQAYRKTVEQLESAWLVEQDPAFDDRATA